MELQFIGAAKTVTGSMHYLKVGNKKFLLDCGLYQGKRKEAFELNRNFEFFDPAEIDFVVLSHAHIDHSGNLPNLVKHGFTGDIYSTYATRDITALMLKDSAHIQNKDVEFVNKKRKRDGKNLFEPLYSQKDVDATNKLFVGVGYDREFKIANNISLLFKDAGHILGSAVTYLEIVSDNKLYRIGFSGDLGRKNTPILKDPQPIPQVDLFICESTYGSRLHEDIRLSQNSMRDVIKKAKSNGGKIIIPSFSLGRTQEVVYLLNKIFEDDPAVKIPVYVDSPLSVNATEIFRLHPECFDEETINFMNKHDDPFGFYKLTFIRDVEDSKKLNSITEPCIIISSSGMAEAGRVLHHLANNIHNPNNIILFVGYCAENTLGRKLIDGATNVRIFGEDYKVNSEVIFMNSLSGHADYKEIIEYCENFDKSILKNIFLVHGESAQQQSLIEKLNANGFANVVAPSRGDIISI